MGMTLNALRGAAIIAGLGLAHMARAQDQTEGIFIPLDLAGLSGDLAVEVDGIDMTEFVELADGGVRVRPGVPLPPGTYEVVVYLWQGDDYEVLVVDTVDLGGETGSAAQVTVTATTEVGTRTYNGDDDDTFARSSGDIQVTTVDNRLTAGASWLATTIEDEEIDGRPVDLAEYFIEWRHAGERVDTTFRLGNQALDYDRLIVSDLTRRGLSAHLGTTDGKLEFGLFGAQSSQDLGGDNLAGLNDRDDRAAGAMVSLTPGETADFRIGAVAVRGRGDPDDLMQTGEGEAAGLFVRGSLDDGRTRYQIDLAQSRWDEDAELLGADPVTANAGLFGIERDVLTGDDGRSLTLGFAVEQVDTGFLSLANPTLADARRDVRLTADYGTDALWLSASLEHQTTNVNGPADYETDHIVTALLDGTYTPYLDGGAPDWMGTPQLIFGAAIIDQRRVETPLLAPDPADFLSVELYAGLDVQHDLWGWSTTYTYSDYDDQAAVPFDETSHRIDGTLDWSNGEGFDVTLTGAVTFTDDTFESYVDQEIGVNLSYEFVPGEWSASGEVNWYGYGASGAVDDTSVVGDVTWSFAPATDLIFSGGWAKGDSASETAEDPEWFVGLMLRHQTSYTGGGF